MNILHFWYGFIIGALTGIGIFAAVMLLVIKRRMKRLQKQLGTIGDMIINKQGMVVQQAMSTLPANKEMYEAMVKREREKQQE